MKKTLVAALALATSTAFAGGFDGPFVQLGIGGSATSSKTSGTDVVDGTSSQGSFNGLVAAGWSESIGKEGFNLAANLFYVIGNQKAGQKSNNWSVVDGSNSWDVGINGQVKLQNTFGISVEPGWNFTDNTLGYVKLAWVNSGLKGDYNQSWACTSGTSCGNGSESMNQNKNVNGFGYGLGVKQLVTKNVFLGVDLMGVTYGSANFDGGVSVKPSQFLGFASVGYKF